MKTGPAWPDHIPSRVRHFHGLGVGMPDFGEGRGQEKTPPPHPHLFGLEPWPFLLLVIWPLANGSAP